MAAVLWIAVAAATVATSAPPGGPLSAAGARLAGPSVAVGPAGMSLEPDDPALVEGLLWNLERIRAPEAWALSTGAGVTVAVVDSGADLDHVELRGRIVGAADCIGAAGDPGRCRTGGSAGQDDSGHGTHVAGIVAAAAGNGTGVAGVAPDARLLVVRSLHAGCDECQATGDAADVAAGIRWAVAHGAQVINLSLGGGQVSGVDSPGCGYCDALDEAWQADVIPVLATGNDASVSSAASTRHAIMVTATDRNDRAASYVAGPASAQAQWRWVLAAPGGEGERDDADCATGGAPRGVLSTYWRADHHDLYACLAGTSMAAPHVTGVLALLLAQGRSPVDAVERLLATANDLGRPGPDPVYGVGRVDAARAVGSAPATASSPSPVTGPATDPALPPTTTAAAPPPSATSPPPVLGDELAASTEAGPNAPSSAEPPAGVLALAALVLVGTWLALLGRHRLRRLGSHDH